MKVFIIAEAGVNHNGSIDIAKKLVSVAANAKADFVKFQTFITENCITINAKKFQEIPTFQIPRIPRIPRNPKKSQEIPRFKIPRIPRIPRNSKRFKEIARLVNDPEFSPIKDHFSTDNQTGFILLNI